MKQIIAIAFALFGLLTFITGMGYLITAFFLMMAAFFFLEPFLFEEHDESNEVTIESKFEEIPSKGKNGKLD